jgi:hypothetical protein
MCWGSLRFKFPLALRNKKEDFLCAPGDMFMPWGIRQLNIIFRLKEYRDEAFLYVIVEMVPEAQCAQTWLHLHLLTATPPNVAQP